MNNVFWVASAMFVMNKLSSDLANDSRIREEEYTRPLATMPDYVDALAREMIDAAASGKNLTPSQLIQIEIGIYKMLGEGAVLQRNHELKKTREKISYFGHFLSWFMKTEGLSYAQIQAKYEKDFSDDHKALHKKIILSASKSNDNLVRKFYDSIVKKVLPSAKL